MTAAAADAADGDDSTGYYCGCLRLSMSTTALVSLFVTCSLCLSCLMLLFDDVGERSLGSLLPGLMSFLRGVDSTPFGSLLPLLGGFRFGARRVLLGCRYFPLV